MESVLIYLVLIAVVAVRFMRGSGMKSGNGNGQKPSRTPVPPVSAAGKRTAGRPLKRFGKGPLASDGHRMNREDDVSCRRFGHEHEEFDTPRYIPHDDPEDGYIVLNGVKMLLSEADRYEDRI